MSHIPAAGAPHMPPELPPAAPRAIATSSNTPAVPFRLPVAEPATGRFPMLVRSDATPVPFHPARHARSHMTGLPPAFLVPNNWKTDARYRLYSRDASASGPFHLKLKGNRLVVNNAMETVQGTILNGEHTYGQEVLDAINHYEREVREGRQPHQAVLIGIPPREPQVYGVLSLDLAGANASAERRGSGRPQTSQANVRPSTSHRLASRLATPTATSAARRVPTPAGTQRTGSAPAPGTTRPAPASGSGRVSRHRTTASSAPAARPHPWPEHANPERDAPPVRSWDRIRHEVSTYKDGLHVTWENRTDSRRDVGYSIPIGLDTDNPVSFAQMTPENVNAAAIGVLNKLDHESEMPFVQNLVQVREQIAEYGRQPTEEAEEALTASIEEFLARCERSNDLLGLRHHECDLIDPVVFALSENFQRFALAVIRIYDNLEADRPAASARFLASSVADSEYLEQHLDPDADRRAMGLESLEQGDRAVGVENDYREMMGAATAARRRR